MQRLTNEQIKENREHKIIDMQARAKLVRNFCKKYYRQLDVLKEFNWDKVDEEYKIGLLPEQILYTSHKTTYVLGPQKGKQIEILIEFRISSESNCDVGGTSYHYPQSVEELRRLVEAVAVTKKYGTW